MKFKSSISFFSAIDIFVFHLIKFILNLKIFLQINIIFHIKFLGEMIIMLNSCLLQAFLIFLYLLFE